MAITKRAGKSGLAYLVRVETGAKQQGINADGTPKMTRTFNNATFKTLKEAQAHEREWKRDKEHGGVVEAKKITTGAYLADWLAEIQHDVRETTYQAYAVTVNHHLRQSSLASIPVQKLQPIHVRAFIAEMRDAGKSAVVIQKCLLRLSQALSQAVGDRLVSTNVCDGVTVKAGAAKAPKTWTAEEAKKFLAASETDTLHPLWYLALATGMRRGELLGLRWQDVDFTRGQVRVSQSVTIGAKGKAIIAAPKTDAGNRTIPIPPTVLDMLQEHKERQTVKSDLVFHTATGGPISPTNVRRNIAAIIKKAGVLPLTIHGLRHTHATLLIQSGENAKVVQERLGHTDITMTLGTYTSVMPGMQEGAAKTIARLLF